MFGGMIRRLRLGSNRSSDSQPQVPARPLVAPGLAAHEEAMVRPTAMDEIFNDILDANHWGSCELLSGVGSQLDQTQALREHLPSLAVRLGARTFLDIPCGDYHWMQHVVLPADYVGADVVESLVRRLQEKHGGPQHRFERLDLIKDELPRADLVFCRDALVHFSYRYIFEALRNIARSQPAYVLLTTFPQTQTNVDIATGQWRPLNLELAPFGFPRPLEMFNERCTQEQGAWRDKSLGLWRGSDVASVASKARDASYD